MLLYKSRGHPFRTGRGWGKWIPRLGRDYESLYVCGWGEPLWKCSPPSLHDNMTRPPKVKYIYLSAPSDVLLYWKVQPLELHFKPSFCLSGAGIYLEMASGRQWNMLGLPGTLEGGADAQTPLPKTPTGVNGDKPRGQKSLEQEEVGLEESLFPVGLPCGPCRYICRCLVSPLSVSSARCLRPWWAIRASMSSTV